MRTKTIWMVTTIRTNKFPWLSALVVLHINALFQANLPRRSPAVGESIKDLCVDTMQMRMNTIKVPTKRMILKKIQSIDSLAYRVPSS